MTAHPLRLFLAIWSLWLGAGILNAQTTGGGLAGQHLTLKKITVPGTPTAGYGTLWLDSSNVLNIKTSAGTTSSVGGGTTLTDSASLLAALSDETGTGLAVFGTSPAFTTSITTGSTTFTALAGATTLLTIGGTGATATVTIPGTEAATGTAGVGALNVAGGANFVTDIWAHGIRLGHGNGAVSTNVAVGASALNSITTAGQNVAVGNDAMLSETSGTGGSVAVGYQAQRAASTGLNTAIGHKSLYSNTGYENTAVGQASGYHNTTGYQNTTIGRNAGTFAADGVTGLLTANTSVYIGYDSRGASNSDSNSIVIAGITGIGEGANTTVIGNSSTTQSHLFGTLLTDASTTTRAGLRLPHGAAPTTPTDGDVWTTTAGMYARINGTTAGPFGAGGGIVVGSSTSDGTAGNVLYTDGTNVQEYTVIPSTEGGTGVNNAGTITNASNTTITGGGTIGLGGYTLTVPAAGTAAILEAANVFTAAQTWNKGSALTASAPHTFEQEWNNNAIAFENLKIKTTLTSVGSAGNNYALAIYSGTTLKGGFKFYYGELAVESRRFFIGENGEGHQLVNQGAGGFNIMVAGTHHSGLFTTEHRLNNSVALGWSSVTYSNPINTSISRDADAVIQFGADAATEIPQTLKGHDGSGTDKAGADFTIAGGKSTGTGRGGDVILSTSLSASSTGSSANNHSTRTYASAKSVALTESSASTFVDISLSPAKTFGARLSCTVCATDGTEYQALNSLVSFSAVSKSPGSIYLGTVTQQDDGTAATSGTLSATYAIVAHPAYTGVTGVASTDVITATGHTMTNGMPVQFTSISGGSGLSTYTTYWVISASTNTFSLSATQGGSAINFTTDITTSVLLPQAVSVTVDAVSSLTQTGLVVKWQIISLNSDDTSTVNPR